MNDKSESDSNEEAAQSIEEEDKNAEFDDSESESDGGFDEDKLITYSDDDDLSLVRKALARESCFGLSQYKCNFSVANSARQTRMAGGNINQMHTLYKKTKRKLMKRNDLIDGDRIQLLAM